MPTYAQQADFENYVEGWTTTNVAALNRLLQRAENDVDKLFANASLTDSLQGISMTGVTGGSFILAILWLGDTYFTAPIQWNAGGVAVLAAMNAAIDSLGNLIPPGSWQIPLTPSSAPNWAQGPFPNVPVVARASGRLGGQVLSLMVPTSSLTGPAPVITVTSLRGGGLRIDPWGITPAQSLALKNATCAQAEFRNAMGEDFFVRAQWKQVDGPEFRTQGKLPMIGPKVYRELQGSDLLQRGARARPGTASGRQLVYSPIGTTPIPDDWRAV